MFLFPSPTGDLYFSITSANICSTKKEFPSPTGDLYFSIPSPQFLVNTDCITQFAWEMIFQKYKFIFHYKKLSKCLFYAVRGKTNIFWIYIAPSYKFSHNISYILGHEEKLPVCNLCNAYVPLARKFYQKYPAQLELLLFLLTENISQFLRQIHFRHQEIPFHQTSDLQ